MLVLRRLAFCALTFLLLLIAAARAEAQWYVAGYFGANHTPAADVAIDAPALDTSVTYRDVQFSAKPFSSPQYYGYRVGRLLGARRRYGVEIEFIHLKVIGETSRDYAASGRAAGVALTGAAVRMSDVVQQFQMTHGLNFALLNFVMRVPMSGSAAPRAALIARAGAGPTIPHAESRVAGQGREQYEFAGLGTHVAAGIDLRLRGRVSALLEYKLTAARPEITVASGTGRMTALTHQVAFGFAFGLARRYSPLVLNAWALAISLALQTPVAPPAAAQTSAPASVQTPAPAPDAIAWPDDQPILRLFQNLALDFRALPSPSTGAVLAIGGGATIAMHPVDDNLSGWARSSGGSSNTRLGNVLGDAWFQVGGAIGAYAGGKIAKNAELTHVGSDLIRAQAINGVITTALKIAADRTRPSGGHRSFPSGHTSASFATAAVLHGHYGWGAGLAGYATAGFISWTRVRDNVHWLSDAIFGGTLGIIAGQTVTHGHRARTWTVVPVKTQGGAAVYFVK